MNHGHKGEDAMSLDKTLSRRNFIRSSAAAMGMVCLPNVGPVPGIDDPSSLNDPRPWEITNDYTGRLCYNENPLGPSPKALKAIKKAASMAHRYPDWFSTTLESRIAEHHGLQQYNICASTGATGVIRLIADAFLSIEDEMITATPSYMQMASDATANGAKVVYVPVDENHVIDLQGISQAIGPKTKLISLVNPNNPPGTIVNKTDMEAFLNEVPAGVVVVVDEAYHYYVDSSNYESCIRFVQEGLPVIVVRTFSKAHGLAGARIGYSVASSEYTALITSSQLFGMVSNLGQAAAEAALNDTEHINNTISVNTVAKSVLETQFTDLGLDFIPSETNFMMFDTGTDAASVASQLASLGYSVRTGWDMPQHIRISTGLISEMHGFVEALKDILHGDSLSPGKRNGEVPKAFGLHSLYPNPFNTQCKIEFSTTGNEKVMLTIYDTLGRKVRSLVNTPLSSGVHHIPWDGKNAHGNGAASGVYIIHLTQGELAESSQITLIK